MSRIGRYEVLEPLGTGAMGRVYRAYDTVLEREVALKTIRTGGDASSELRQRFQREARACARLRHPNIITVFDFGETEDLAYIAMELLRGADFRRLIQERGTTPLETRIAAAAQVCDALAYAHRDGLVHRDIKPSNLFLTDEGSAKVLDFGIARLPASNLTMRGQVLGTPKYMSPEQIQGHPSDGRSDLFSLAVVLFEILTGVYPFQSPMAPQRIVQGAPDSLLALDPSLPPAIERVVMKGLEKDPQLRYATGDEFARDLREVLGSLPKSVPAAAPVGMPQAGSSAAAAVPVAAAPAPVEAPVARVECPPGEDPEEWRFAEAYRLLPEFEAAVERKDIATARRLLSDLEARLEGDIRFAEALRLCRSRMPLPPAPPPPAPVPPPPPRAPQAASAAAPPVPMAMPAGLDVEATMFGRTSIQREVPQAPPVVPMAPPPPPSPVAAAPMAPPPREEPPPVYRPERPPEEPPRAAMVPPQPSPASEANGESKSKKGLLIAAVVLCGLGLAAAAYVYLQPPGIEPAVATAVVGRGGAKIYSNPSAGESVVTSAPGGEQVNVLNLPTNRGQEWIRVQVVKPEVSRPGYIHTSSLGGWEAQTAAGALAVARLGGPEDAGTAEGMEAQADRLSEVGARFASDPAARQARLEAARLRLSAATRAREAGAPASQWTAWLSKAQDDLRGVSGDPQLQDTAMQLSQQIAGILNSLNNANNVDVKPVKPTKKR